MHSSSFGRACTVRLYNRLIHCFALVLPMALAGCFFAFGTGTSDLTTPDTPVNGVTPCFADACGEKVTIANIGDAENLLFTSSGRLFVSGGERLTEITRTAAGDYLSTDVSVASCNFTGLAVIQSTLFAACFDGSLWAGSLNAVPMRVSRVATIAGVNAGNGLVDGPDGTSLFLVNGPSGNPAKIVRIRLNPQAITQVASAADWLTSGLSFPNGLQRKGNTLFFSDSDAGSLGRLKSVPILADGNAGAVSNLAAFNSLPDDFSFIENDFAVSFFSSGQIARLSATGQTLQSTGMNRFESPSQVRIARAPLFRDGDLLVTEKGVIGDNNSTVGNRLTLYRTR